MLGRQTVQQKAGILGRASVLHAGDVFVRYGYPFIDLSSGGSVAGMIAGCERILAIVSRDDDRDEIRHVAAAPDFHSARPAAL